MKARLVPRMRLSWGLLYGWVAVLVSVGGFALSVEGMTERWSGGSLRVPDRQADSPPLRVHIVPHTHCDAGWLKTYLQYYWGDGQGIQAAGVGTILNSVVEALLVDPARRFIFAEMAFFSLWYRQQTEKKKAAVRRLVSTGQLEFVSGGFVQHDEAASHYVAMIDQTTRGHRFLKQEFGYVPRVGWQIDPFGHSSAQAGLMGAALGFDSMFFGRADWEDMSVRKSKKQLEFLWKGTGAGPMSCDMEQDKMIFTGNFASGNYVPPAGFNFEFAISDAPIQDDPLLRGYNVEDRVAEFVARCEELAAMTRGDDIMFTMGSDFHYAAAEAWFTNLDKLIKAVNARFGDGEGDGEGGKNRGGHHRKIEVFYSTPSEYVKAKARQANSSDVSYPVKVDDFFPYSDGREAFWTGYFTSRPTSKRYIRMATSFLQAARQLEVYYGSKLAQRKDKDNRGKSCSRGTDQLEEAVALTQHHDSITGTEKQAVADDYHVWLSDGMHAAEEVVIKALEAMYDIEKATDGANGQHRNFVFCRLNESMCDFTVERDRFTTTVYNPTSFRRDIPIAIPVSLEASRAWQVLGPDGQRLDADVMSVDDVNVAAFDSDVMKRHKSRIHQANVVFVASVEPLGMSSYLISAVDDEPRAQHVEHKPSNDREISNGQMTLSFDRSGMAASITYEELNVTMPFSFDMLWYNSSDGRNSDINHGQSSGAYIFRPNGKYPLSPNNVTLEIMHGDVVSEARQTFNSWGSLITRLYKDQPYLEVEWTVGPMPLDDTGREVVISYKVPPSLSDFWTDINGRAMIRRLRRGRFSWDSRYADTIAANYYPITSAAVLQDEAPDAPGASLTVLTDRAQGAASLQEGELEIMLHRRTIVDDARGVEEPLDERQCHDEHCRGLVARGRHHVIIEYQKSTNTALRRRTLQQELNDDAVVVFSKAMLYRRTPARVRSQSMLSERAKSAFTFPIHILTLKEETKTSTERTLTLRIAHQMDDINTLDGGRPRSINPEDLMDLVRSVGCSDIRSATEVSLSTNQGVNDALSPDRPRFKVSSEVVGDVACEQVYFDHRQRSMVRQGPEDALTAKTSPIADAGDVRFEPMSIRTYQIVCGT